MYGCKLQQRVGVSALWAPHLISLQPCACWRLGNRMRETAEGPEGSGVGPKMDRSRIRLLVKLKA